MARRKIELFIDINNEKDFENALEKYKDKFICAEIFSSVFGSCKALDKDMTKLKVEWGEGEVVLLRVLADEIEAVSRLRNQSEPFYMFIFNKKVSGVLRGVSSIKFQTIVKKELQYYFEEKQGMPTGRPKYEIDEPTPAEMEWINDRATEREQEKQSLLTRQTARQAARKRHRAELMAPHLASIDFVLYWPHATHAHPELYEHWNENNLIMVGREEFRFTEEQAKDILYSGDAPINEASIHALLAGPALAICLRSLDPVDIVALVRKILYEDSKSRTNDSDDKKAGPLSKTAFEYYKTFSPNREQIIQKRREERDLRIEEKKEKRARILAEMQRLAHQRREEAIEAKKMALEQKKMDLLKTGKLAELDQLNAEAEDPEDVDIEIPEELSEAAEEEEEVEDDPDEYFPPPGLPIPGFYSPPNDIAKANGLAILFPNIVLEYTKPTEEFLPPHVLVMLHMHKRHKAIEHMTPFKYGILHMGIFKANTPYNAKHIAYSVKQFDSMDFNTSVIDDFKLCFMVSTKVDVPLLELMELTPLHVSRDTTAGGDECAAMFRVDYGDNYPEFEDFEHEEAEDDAK